MGAEIGVPGWQRLLPESDAIVECGGANHTIRWRRGKLVLADHDLRAEAVMASLGGAPPRCFEVLSMWRRARRTARAVKVDEETFAYFRARGIPMGEQFAAALLPEPLRELRERTTWLRKLRAGGPHDQLLSTIRRRATPGIYESLAPVATPERVSVDVRIAPPGARARALGDTSGMFRQVACVSLPSTWLTTVGLLDLVTIDGRFILAVEPAASPSTLHAVALRWRRTGDGELRAVGESITLDYTRNGWTIRRAAAA